MYKNKTEPWLNERRGLKMDKDLITTKQNGKTVNLYRLIQSRNVDTEIYPTLYKYGSLKPIEIDREWLCTGLKCLESMNDIEMANKEAERLFLTLPAEIQALYGKSYAEFAKDKGEKALKQIRSKENVADNNTNDTTDNSKAN